MGECVNSCSLFLSEGACVEDHCGWNGKECTRGCFKYDEEVCTNFQDCFWVKGDISNNDEKCMIKVSKKLF
jgi:phage protein D